MIKSNLNMMALFEINAKKKIEQTELHKYFLDALYIHQISILVKGEV